MSEYSDIYQLSPSILRRDDLMELCRVIGSGIDDADPLEIRVTAQERAFDGASWEDIEQQNLPKKLTHANIKVSSTYKSEPRKRVSVTLSRHSASCYIASTDEFWFSGKRQQLEQFFRARRPWYGVIRMPLFGAMGALSTLIFLSLPYAVFRHSIASVLFLVATAALTFVVSRRMLRWELMPHTDINLTDNQSIFNSNNIMVTSTVIMALCAIAALCLQWYRD